jgi:AbiV family abortive infection protein
MNDEELYGNMAMLSYENAYYLREEAKLLFDNQRYPRAFALAVLSIEEQTKSLICKCISAGIMKPEELTTRDKGGRIRNVLKDHEAKQFLFGFIEAGSKAVKDNVDKMFTPNPTNEIPDIGTLNMEGAKDVIGKFKSMKVDRESAIYVGMDGEQIITPYKQFGPERSKEMLDFASGFLKYWTTLLSLSTPDYRAYYSQFDVMKEIIESNLTNHDRTIP